MQVRLTVLAILAAACATTAPPGTASPTAVSVTPSPPSAPTATPAATPTSAPLTFRSRAYPYTLSLPGGVATGPARAAPRHWNGEEPIRRASGYMDRIGLAAGGALWLFGARTGETLDAFEGRVVGNVRRFNGCGPPDNRRKLRVAGGAAVGFTQSCAEQTRAARVVMVRDGFGLVAMVVNGGDPASALERLSGWVRGLKWTA
jgi:hypothetical protein